MNTHSQEVSSEVGGGGMTTTYCYPTTWRCLCERK